MYEDLIEEINYKLIQTPNININANTNIINLENQINNAHLEAEKNNNLTVSKLIL